MELAGTTKSSWLMEDSIKLIKLVWVTLAFISTSIIVQLQRDLSLQEKRHLHFIIKVMDQAETHTFWKIMVVSEWNTTLGTLVTEFSKTHLEVNPRELSIRDQWAHRLISTRTRTGTVYLGERSTQNLPKSKEILQVDWPLALHQDNTPSIMW